MKDAYEIVHQTLQVIYSKHQRKYRGNNSRTKQMCYMWSTKNPPDTLLNTQPICDIEDAFNIEFDEYTAVEIYDMTLDEAVEKIMEMQSV